MGGWWGGGGTDTRHETIYMDIIFPKHAQPGSGPPGSGSHPYPAWRCLGPGALEGLGLFLGFESWGLGV